MFTVVTGWIQWSRVNVQNVNKQFQFVECAPPLYPLNIRRYRIPILKDVSRANVGESTIISCYCLTKCVNTTDNSLFTSHSIRQLKFGRNKPDHCECELCCTRLIALVVTHAMKSLHYYITFKEKITFFLDWTAATYPLLSKKNVCLFRNADLVQWNRFPIGVKNCKFKCKRVCLNTQIHKKKRCY